MVETCDCVIKSNPRLGYLTAEAKQQMKEIEMYMRAEDRKQQEAREAMNTLTSNVYCMKDKMAGTLRGCTAVDEAQLLKRQLAVTEVWIV